MLRDNTPLPATQQQVFSSPSTGGEVIPFDRSESPDKAEYVAAIRMWCVDRSLQDALSREEIGAMKAFDRIDAQRKAIIVHLAHYYRKHDRADVAPGLAVVLTLLSDNNEGCAKVSQELLASFFGRSRSAIYQAQSRLKEAGIIVTGRGRYAKTYPVIPRVVTERYNHLAWTVGAIAQDTSNCSVSASNSQLLWQPKQLSQLHGPTEQLEAVNCSVEPVSIAKAACAPIHYKSSTTQNSAGAMRAAAAGIAAAMGALPAAAAPSQEPPAIIQPVKPSLKELSDKLFEAGGNALNRTTAGLEIMSTPKRWVDAGCDLELDILPTVRALASRQGPQRIGSWKFFDAAVFDAKAARTAPVPKGTAAISAKAAYKDREQTIADGMLERMWAEEQRKKGIPA